MSIPSARLPPQVLVQLANGSQLRVSEAALGLVELLTRERAHHAAFEHARGLGLLVSICATLTPRSEQGSEPAQTPPVTATSAGRSADVALVPVLSSALAAGSTARVQTLAATTMANLMASPSAQASADPAVAATPPRPDPPDLPRSCRARRRRC